MSDLSMDIKKLAHLSQLTLTDAEMESYRQELGDIVSHFDVLNQYPLSKALDTQALGELGPLREDCPKQIEMPFTAENAPDFEESENSFVVPPVL